MRHTCGGPVFGKLAPKGECPRCDELRNGSPARKGYRTGMYGQTEAQRIEAIRQHSCVASKCGPICTFGDW